MPRHNPRPILTGGGELENPRGGVLWIHTTDTPAEEFESDGFEFDSGAFYISSGASTGFGTNILFLTYSPTKLFDPEDDAHRAQLMACVRSEMSVAEARMYVAMFSNAREMDLGPSADPFEFIDAQLKFGTYLIFETIPPVRGCLERLGYTAYFENEGDGFGSGEANIAVLPSDFSRLTIVGAVDQSRERTRTYVCPRCRAATGLKDLIRGTLREGPTAVQCRACAEVP